MSNEQGSQRTALVTGASKGIGAAIARRLAADGFAIWLNYQSDHEAAAAVAAEIEGKGGACRPLPFDVRSAASCKEALEPLLREETPYILVNNAGFARDNVLSMMSESDWADVLAVHLNGFYNVTSLVLPKMQRKKTGRIINVASTSGQTGIGGQVNYSTAKAGLIGATRSLAVEVARRNILVNAVAPGFIDTDMLAKLPLENIVPTIPMQRVGSPAEVAGAVSFLASDDASYITGQVIAINGGLFTG